MVSNAQTYSDFKPRQLLENLIPWLESECAAAGLPSFAIAAEDGSGRLVDHVWAPGLAPFTRPLFRYGSLSKMVTVTALMLAQTKGYVSLATPVADLLPEIKGTRGLPTLRLVDLMTHKSTLAFAEGDALHGLCGRYLSPPTLSESMLLRRILKRRPPTKSFKWRYSDFGFALAAIALKRVTSQSYERFLCQALLEPQGLDLIRIRPIARGLGIAPLPGHIEPENTPLALRSDFGDLQPSFGLYGDIGQINRLLHRLLTGRLLPVRDTQRLMRFPHRLGSLGDGYRAGFGLFRLPVGDPKAGDYCIGHQAVFGGTCGFAAHHPISGLTLTFFTNTLSSRPNALGKRREPNPIGLVRHIFQHFGSEPVSGSPPLWRRPSII